jgi:hypothetical protein
MNRLFVVSALTSSARDNLKAELKTKSGSMAISLRV